VPDRPGGFFAGRDGMPCAEMAMVKAVCHKCRPACGSDRGIEAAPSFDQDENEVAHEYRHGRLRPTARPNSTRRGSHDQRRDVSKQEWPTMGVEIELQLIDATTLSSGAPRRHPTASAWNPCCDAVKPELCNVMSRSDSDSSAANLVEWRPGYRHPNDAVEAAADRKGAHLPAFWRTGEPLKTFHLLALAS